MCKHRYGATWNKAFLFTLFPLSHHGLYHSGCHIIDFFIGKAIFSSALFLYHSTFQSFLITKTSATSPGETEARCPRDTSLLQLSWRKSR